MFCCCCGSRAFLMRATFDFLLVELPVTIQQDGSRKCNNSDLQPLQDGKITISRRLSINVYLVYGQASAHIPCRQSYSVCSVALHACNQVAVTYVVLHFLQRGTYLGVCQHFCGQILSSDFVHKTFLVLLTSRLQNQHACARWGLINAHALA